MNGAAHSRLRGPGPLGPRRGESGRHGVWRRQEASGEPRGTQGGKRTRTLDFLPRVVGAVQQRAVTGCEPGRQPSCQGTLSWPALWRSSSRLASAGWAGLDLTRGIKSGSF